MSKRITLTLSLVAALLTGGCSGPLLYQSTDTSAALRDNHHDAKIFVYAAYDNPEDKPSFDDVFRVHAGLGYLGDINDTQYVDTMLSPGRHTITVDRINWAGDTIGLPATLIVDVKPGQPLFIEEHVLANDKAMLSNVDSEQVEQDLKARTRVCPCDDRLFGL